MLEFNFKFKSPNFTLRPDGVVIDTIVIHYTEMKDDLSALERLCDPLTEVSAHYLINKQGQVFSLVADHLRAWHAGPSCWKNREKVNDYSIGIELDNNGSEEFPLAQMHSLIKLCHLIQQRYPIDPFNIIGHADIIPSRKFDPGRLFNWRLLAENNLGIYPVDNIKAAIPEVRVIQSLLAEYGYKIDITSAMDLQTLAVMRAFNEHFSPDCHEPWSEQSQGALNQLIARRMA